ncbi:MAG: hypothetical protein ACHQWU_04905 [Gemmatimonadales bacterium]
MADIWVGNLGSYVVVRNAWVGQGGVWKPVIKGWVGLSSSYDLTFDSTPGPLASIVVSPSSASLTAGISDQQQFTAQGFDSRGRVVTISPTWSISTLTDSIDASGLFTAGGTTDSGTVTAQDGSISGTASYTVS